MTTDKELREKARDFLARLFAEHSKCDACNTFHLPTPPAQVVEAAVSILTRHTFGATE